jgi:biopolymer transport protein ExbD
MAEKRRFLDVWLVESNTVYREVPFHVVTDWIQQARLVADDQIRNSGTAQWYKVGESPDFKPYLPQPDEAEIEDQTEATESVDMGFHWKRPGDEEDDDVDMIPLIDVSLVLLIFFMLTSSAAVASYVAQLPNAYNGMVTDKGTIYYVNVDLVDGKRGNPIVCSVSVSDGAPKDEDKNLATITEAVGRLKALLGGQTDKHVVIRAHRDVDSGEIRDLTVLLQREGIKEKFIAVGDKVQR